MAVQLDKLGEGQLYENHNRSTLRRWCESLNFFHYMRARRGHNCEGDTFAAHFTHDDREDLIDKLNQLGIELKKVSTEDLVFDPFKSYSFDDLDRIKYTIPGFDDLIQPNQEVIFGYSVHMCVQQNHFEIIVVGTKTGSAYEVTEEDFNSCLAIEKEFKRLNWQRFLDAEIKKQPHCISEYLYPELY
ncbi:MAG: hypothetical protein GX905_06870 [Bacteroidales bacterium]|nr:hypothetical protein [Bacteroidales bacterium]